MADLRSVVQDVAKSLECSVELEADAYFLTIAVTEAEDDDEDDRTQLVRIEEDVENELVVVSTDVGAYDDDLDLAEALRFMSEAFFSRLYVSPEVDDQPEQLVVEAALPSDRIDAELLANVVEEVAEVADELELMFFDGDDDEDTLVE